MVNLQVRNVPEEVLDVLREEASENGRSLQQHVRTLLDEHTAAARLRSLLYQLDDALGDEQPVLAVDPAQALRADRDEREKRDSERAEDFG